MSTRRTYVTVWVRVSFRSGAEEKMQVQVFATEREANDFYFTDEEKAKGPCWAVVRECEYREE